MKRWVNAIYISAAAIAAAQLVNIIFRLCEVFTHHLYCIIEDIIVLLVVMLWFASFIAIIAMNDGETKKSGK